MNTETNPDSTSTKIPGQNNPWDEEMQVRVYGAAPADDYNFKKKVTPNYSGDPDRARELVDTINASGRYQIRIDRPGAGGGECSVEVRGADGTERLSQVRGVDEAQVICEAIVTADVKL